MPEISKKHVSCVAKKLRSFANVTILVRAGQKKVQMRVAIMIHGILNCKSVTRTPPENQGEL